MSEPVEISRHANGVVMVRLTRPEKKNALNKAMYDAMRETIEQAGVHGTRAVVFAGAPGAFTAGNDISDFIMRAQSGAESAPAGLFIQALATVEVPMIAAVDGLAIGVGTTMLFHMDLCFASPRATFRMPFVDLGLVPEAASSLLVPRLAGYRKATEYLMMGEGFGPEEALAMGLLNAIVPSEELEARALAAAAKLAAKPPQALAATRRLIRGDSAELRQRMADENKAFSAALKGDEARQAFMSFMARK